MPVPAGEDPPGGQAVNPKYGTTIANAISSLSIQTDKWVRRFWVESVDGTDIVYFTVDGSDPALGQDGSSFLAPGSSLPFEFDEAQQVTVRFKSAGVVKVSVRYQA